MKQLRKIIFWCHLLLGTTGGIVVLIMSVTGVLLSYERQMTYWADMRAYNAGPPYKGAERIPIETLLTKFRKAQPDAMPVQLTLHSDAAAPVALSLSDGRTLFVDAYSGETLGEGAKSTREFFRVVTNWHRWLAASDENRAAARAVTEACNFAFLFIIISGFYMWWPRSWQWSHIRNVIWFKGNLFGKARDFNWHNVIGSWCAAPLFIIVLSGVVMSYNWANDLVYRIHGESPQPRGVQPTGEGRERPTRPAIEGLNVMLARAQSQTLDWRSINFRMPTSNNAPVSFTIDASYGGQPQKKGDLTLRRNGDLVRWEPFASNTPGRRMRIWFRFAHTGEAAGLPGQTIAGLATAGALVLIYTGPALAWRRLRAWQGRRARKPNLSPSPVSAEGTASSPLES